MKHTSNRGLGGAAPTAGEMELLRAALLPPEPAADAWRRWRSAHDLDTAPWRSREIMPAVAANVPPDVLGRDAAELRRRRQRTWADNQRHIKTFADVAGILHEVGVVPIAIKGIGLITTVYDDISIRPMADIDVLVPPEQFDRALGALGDSGWRDERALELAAARHAAGLSDAGQRQVDLHRWAAFPRFTRNREEGFLARCEPHLIGDVECRRPSSADEFVLAVVHGIRGGSNSEVRWPLDAAQFCRRASADQDIWVAAVRSAHELRVADVLLAGLGMVHDDFGIPIPTDVFDELRRSRPDRVIRVEWWAMRHLHLRSPLRRFIDAERALGSRPRLMLYTRARLSALARVGVFESFGRRVAPRRYASGTQR